MASAQYLHSNENYLNNVDSWFFDSLDLGTPSQLYNDTFNTVFSATTNDMGLIEISDDTIDLHHTILTQNPAKAIALIGNNVILNNISIDIGLLIFAKNISILGNFDGTDVYIQAPTLNLDANVDLEKIKIISSTFIANGNLAADFFEIISSSMIVYGNLYLNQNSEEESYASKIYNFIFGNQEKAPNGIITTKELFIKEDARIVANALLQVNVTDKFVNEGLVGTEKAKMYINNLIIEHNAFLKSQNSLLINASSISLQGIMNIGQSVIEAKQFALHGIVIGNNEVQINTNNISFNKPTGKAANIMYSQYGLNSTNIFMDGILRINTNFGLFENGAIVSTNKAIVTITEANSKYDNFNITAIGNVGITDYSKSPLKLSRSNIESQNGIARIIAHDLTLEKVLVSSKTLTQTVINRTTTIDKDSMLLSHDLVLFYSQQDVTNYGSIISSNITQFISYKGFKNYGQIASLNNITIYCIDEILQYGQIYTNAQLKLYTVYDNVVFHPESITKVGSYIIEPHPMSYGLLPKSVECIGCSLITTDPDATSKVMATFMQYKMDSYKKDSHVVMRKEFLVDQYTYQKWNGKTGKILNRKKTIVEDVYASFAMVQESHEYGNKGLGLHSGKLDLYVDEIEIDKSDIIVSGPVRFLKEAKIKIIDSTITKYVTAAYNSITSYNTIENLVSHFGISESSVTRTGSTYKISEELDKITSSFYAGGGFQGTVGDIIIGNTGEIPTITKNYIGSIGAYIPDNMPNDRMMLGSSKKLLSSNAIEKEPLNSNVWHTFSGEARKEFEPLKSLKGNYLSRQLIEQEWGILEFLTDIALQKHGYSYMIGDTSYIEKLTHDALVSFMGIVTNAKASDILKSLCDAALLAKQTHNFIPGSVLTKENINKLTMPIIWPVWVYSTMHSNPILSFEIYLPNNISKLTANNGLVSAGIIDLKVLHNLFVSYSGAIRSNEIIQIQADQIINLGQIYSSKDTILLGNNILNLGDIKSEDLFLKATNELYNSGKIDAKTGYLSATNIKEMLLIDPKIPTMPKGKAIYVIDGNLYYEAEKSIQQEGVLIFAKGKVAMNGEEIKLAGKHIDYEAHKSVQKKWYSLDIGVAGYDAIIIAEKGIDIDAKHATLDGVKLASLNGDVRVHGDENLDIKSKTHYADSHTVSIKKSWYKVASTTTMWTNYNTLQVMLQSENGDVYISSKDCTLEGAFIKGKQLFIKCDSFVIKEHVVELMSKRIKKQSGFLGFSSPLFDIQHHILPDFVYSVQDALKIDGPLDLLPLMKAISDIPSFKKDIAKLQNALKGDASELLAGLADKLISVSAKFGQSTQSTFSKSKLSLPSTIQAESCFIEGNTGVMKGHFNCANVMHIVVGKLNIESMQNRFYSSSELEQKSFSLGVGRYGVKASANYKSAAHSEDSMQYLETYFISENIVLEVENDLTIKGASINGKRINITAGILELEQVLDTRERRSKSLEVELGITVLGPVFAPYASASGNIVPHIQKSEVVNVISRITGESTYVTAKSFIGNLAQITGNKELKLAFDKYQNVDMPEPQTHSSGLYLNLMASYNNKGELKTALSGRYENDDLVLSGGYFSSFKEGVDTLVEEAKGKGLLGRVLGLGNLFIEKIQDLFSSDVEEYPTPEPTPTVDFSATKVPVKQTKQPKPTAVMYAEVNIDGSSKDVDDIITRIRSSELMPEPEIEKLETIIKPSDLQLTVKQAAGKAVELIDWYIKIEQKYPFLAKYGASVLNVGLKTIAAGVPGMVSAISQEAFGFAAGEAAGPILYEQMQKLASYYLELNPILTKLEAEALATLSVGGPLSASNMKGLIHEFHHAKIKVDSKIYNDLKDDLSYGKMNDNSHNIKWTYWKDYDKVIKDGKEYAKIGNWLYTKHALENLYPSGIGMPAGHTSLHHPIGVSPKMVNEVLSDPKIAKHEVTKDGIKRFIYDAGDVKIVTEDNIIITVARVG